MKGFLIAMVLMASAFFIPVNLSCQEKEILCCRPVCECNPENLMCDFKNIEELYQYTIKQTEKIKEVIIDFESLNPLLIFMFQCDHDFDVIPIFIQMKFKDFKLFFKGKMFEGSLSKFDEPCKFCGDILNLAGIIFYVITEINGLETLFIRITTINGENKFIALEIIRNNRNVTFKEFKITPEIEIYKDDFRLYP